MISVFTAKDQESGYVTVAKFMKKNDWKQIPNSFPSNDSWNKHLLFCFSIAALNPTINVWLDNEQSSNSCETTFATVGVVWYGSFRDLNGK